MRKECVTKSKPNLEPKAFHRQVHRQDLTPYGTKYTDSLPLKATGFRKTPTNRGF
jgi:hypothetical protein